MAVLIKVKFCTGCGRCAGVCPGNLLRIGADGKIYIRKPKECWSCASCVKECPSGALFLVLSPAGGGRGAMMGAGYVEGKLVWTVKKPDGAETVIITDPKEANKY